MRLSERVYKGLKNGKRPNIVDEEDLLYTEINNKGEWEALVKKVALEEEDYIPTEEDPDLWIINEDFEEDVEDESTKDRVK